MSSVRIPGSLRRPIGKPASAGTVKKDASVTTLVTAACLAAASPATIALAQTQTTPLPPLSVEAKQQKKKAAPAPAKKSGSTAVAPAAPAAAPQLTFEQKSANPYANPDAPYKVEQSASGKLTEPLVNTPRTVTVIPKEVIEDKGARDLRDLARSIPGLTIGSAEGGNSYGAFAIRGFKASNDIFVDSIRNPGNVIPDVFSVQQVEIYKGPSGGIAGRSTIGGAVNIISKQPDLNSSFYEVTTTLGTDKMFRTTLDANQKVTPDFAVRANLMYDQHGIAGRDITESERWGGLLSATARLSDSVKVTLDYYRYRNNAIPDWGVPARDIDNVPVTELGIPRNTWVGMKGLDFFKEEADIVTGMVVAKLAEGVTLTNRSRAGKSRLDYVATSMEGYPDVHHPNRDQTAGIYANQTEVNFRFNTGPFHHNLVAGVEVSRETIDRFGYNVTNRYDSQTPHPRVPAAFPSQSIRSRFTDSNHRKRPRLRRNDRHDRNVPYRYGPFVQAMDRQRRHPARRLQSRPGRRAGNQCAGLSSGKHRDRHEHGKRSGQPPQLECRPCLQADPDRKLLCSLRNGSKARLEASSIPPVRSTTASAPRSSMCPHNRRAASRSAPSGSCSTSACLRQRHCSRPTSITRAPMTT